MRRTTHLLLGAAVGIPIAVSLSPGLAIGGLWWGMVGGGFPDWFDLRSDFRGSLRLRHRGISHSLVVAATMSAVFASGLRLLRRESFSPFGIDLTIPDVAIWPWTLCFLLGILSHLVSDSMTFGGIQPLLPLSRKKFHLLPTVFRSRYDGYLDTVIRYGALLGLVGGLAWYLANQ